MIESILCFLRVLLFKIVEAKLLKRLRQLIIAGLFLTVLAFALAGQHWWALILLALILITLIATH